MKTVANFGMAINFTSNIYKEKCLRQWLTSSLHCSIDHIVWIVSVLFGTLIFIYNIQIWQESYNLPHKFID